MWISNISDGIYVPFGKYDVNTTIMATQKIDREGILTRSFQLFRTQGYSGTSMSDIGKACGIFKSGIYHYFPTKESLLDAIMERTQTKLRTEVISVLQDRSLEPRARMAKFLDRLEPFYFQEDGGCLFGNLALEVSSHNQQVRLRIAETFREWMVGLTEVFSSRYTVMEAEMAAQRALEEIQGSVMLTRVFRDRTYFEAAKERLLRMVG